MTQHRELPKFAPQTFRSWFRERTPLRASGDRVILWADTFNNYFFPHTAQAAVEVLEDAGCRVEVPGKRLCCGRPLYDYGMLDRAKARLLHILAVMQPAIREGVPVVVLEPSCLSVFREEMTNLLADNDDAKRFREQTMNFSDFLQSRDYQPPKLERKAIVHGHCHHKSVLGMDAEYKVMSKMGLNANVLESGCCGMAGSFGYEEG